jgi:galactitol-specific phosphotransferase system IIC component
MESYHWWQDISKRHAVGSAGTKAKFIFVLVCVLLLLVLSLVFRKTAFVFVPLWAIWSLQLLIALRWAMVRLQKHEPDLS